MDDISVIGECDSESITFQCSFDNDDALLEECTVKDVLGIDIGYGDVKVIYGDTTGKISKIFKFPSAIGVTQRTEYVADTRIVDFKEHSYYVGEDALSLPSSSMVDIAEYKNLEYYAPLFLYHAIKLIGLDEMPGYVVCGLSKAQICNSGYFKEALESFVVNGVKFSGINVSVLPQGAGSKITVDTYGDEFPQQQRDMNSENTFIGVDIGFNTIDIFLVMNGKTSPSLFEGIEHQGVMKLAQLVAAYIKSEFNRELTLHEAKDILDTGVYKLRGQRYDISKHIYEIKQNYLNEIQGLINSRYGDVIDKCDFVYLSGGGSAMFKDIDPTEFFRTPKKYPEFYNAIGFYLYGIQK